MDPFNFEQFNQNNTQTQYQVPKFQGLPVKKSLLIALVATIVISAIIYYMYLPAINIRSMNGMYYIAFIFGVFSFISVFLSASWPTISKVTTFITITIVLAINALSLYSSPIFQAQKYHDQILMNESLEFSEEFEAIALDKIPLIDYAVAKQLGDKKMGQISGLGSQYKVSDAYTLVSVKDELYRVSPLEYRDVFKWLQNYNRGIPGYIKVNVNDPSDVELVELEEGMRYSPSSFFLQNLERHVRFNYPNAIITDYSFELDDESNPYWVVSTYEPEVGFYGGNDANGVIIIDPISGASEKYKINDVPNWVDRVQPAEFAMEQVNNWGLYSQGFLNTILGQKDMIQTTEGYNYVLIDNQMHLYTGLTSVGADNSIVGFALVNLKTKDATFYKIGGADEASAMQSAEGQVQNLGYKATFPILLNVNGEPSYFVSLKDNAQLVKKYAFVSVENYQIVGIGDTVAQAQVDYLKQLQANGLDTNISGETNELSGKIVTMQSAILDSNSMYYFTLEGSDKLFMAPLSLSSELVMSKVGDEVKINYVDTPDNTLLIDSFDNLNLEFN